MKEIMWFSFVSSLAFAIGTLSATPINCTTPAPPVTLATVSSTFGIPPNPVSPSVTCGPLVFSNFQAVSADSGTSLGLQFNYVSPATFDSSTGTVLLSFNPNFSVPMAPGLEDIHLFFDVTATAGFSINGVDGNIGGTNSHYTEVVCNGAHTYNGSGSCTAGSLASFTIFSPNGNQPVISFAGVQSVGIFKDIQSLGPGALTALGQTFEVAGPTGGVPEPATLGMLGGGLALLAFARRRKRA